MNVQASERLVKIMRVLAEYKFLTTSQIKELGFENIKTCQRWMRNKVRQGYLKWFSSPPIIGQTGRLERVYYPNPKRALEIRALLQLPQEQPLIMRPPSNPVKIGHLFKINDFIIALICGLGQKYSFECIPEYGRGRHKILKANEKYISDRVALPVSPYREVSFIPDAVFAIKNPASGRKALFFLEIDNGTESVISLKNKLLAYTGYARGRFQRYSKEFDFSFNGFRTLIVTSGQTRLRHLLLLCKEFGTMFWLTTFDRINPSTILTPIWAVAGTEEYRAIVKTDEKKE